jgi:hypothetical protein
MVAAVTNLFKVGTPSAHRKVPMITARWHLLPLGGDPCRSGSMTR